MMKTEKITIIVVEIFTFEFYLHYYANTSMIGDYESYVVVIKTFCMMWKRSNNRGRTM